MVHVGGTGRIVQWRWADAAEMVVIAIDPVLFAEVAADLGAVNLDIGTVVGVFDWKIRHLANLCERELRDGGCNGRLYLESLGTALSVHLIRHYGQSRRSLGSARGGIAPARLRHVLGYIEEHLAENVPLSDLAAIAGMSLHHFAHAFKQSSGLSPHRFLIERRIARAQLLLADSALSIAEIALILGFGDQSHFTEHFRHVTGITPARYRRDL